ncbi:MAG: hypothetical protein R2854_17865 [Caldilineaceae bacterium]
MKVHCPDARPLTVNVLPSCAPDVGLVMVTEVHVCGGGMGVGPKPELST